MFAGGVAWFGLQAELHVLLDFVCNSTPLPRGKGRWNMSQPVELLSVRRLLWRHGRPITRANGDRWTMSAVSSLASQLGSV